MRKGRKIQREWSKVPGGNKKVPEVFSEGQPQGEVFESKDQFEEDKYSRSDRVYASQMGQFKASWFSRRSGLLKLGIGLVVIVCLFCGALHYVRYLSHQRDSYSTTKKTGKVPTDSSVKTEFTFFGEDSPYIDKDHRIELSIEDFISLVRKANEPNVTPEQIVDQIGKAVSGHLSSSSDGSQRIGLEYELVGDTGRLSLNFLKEQDSMELSSVTYYTRKSFRGEVTKTSKDYKALQASSEEGLELTEAVKELGTPDFMHNNYAIGGVKRITIVYTTKDKMSVFMSFDETGGRFRLKSIRSVEDKS